MRDDHPAVLGAEVRRHQIPALGEQWGFGRDRGRVRSAGGDGEFEGAGVVEKELEARAGHGIAPREDRLRPLPRHRRPDCRKRRERGEIAERRVVFDDAVGTRMNGLKTPLEGASQIHVDGILPIAGAVGIDVALDDAHQLGLVAGQPVAAHLDLDRFAGSRAQPVGVSQNPHSRISRCCPAPFGIDPQSDRGLAGVLLPAQLEHRPLRLLEAVKPVARNDFDGVTALARHLPEPPALEGLVDHQHVLAGPRPTAHRIEHPLQPWAVEPVAGVEVPLEFCSVDPVGLGDAVSVHGSSLTTLSAPCLVSLRSNATWPRHGDGGYSPGMGPMIP